MACQSFLAQIKAFQSKNSRPHKTFEELHESRQELPRNQIIELEEKREAIALEEKREAIEARRKTRSDSA